MKLSISKVAFSHDINKLHIVHEAKTHMIPTYVYYKMPDVPW